MRIAGSCLVLAGLLGLLVGACGGRDFDEDAVHLLTYDGNVDPVMERYVERGIEDAEDSDARAIVLKLDTPGGLLDTTRNIVRDISGSTIPVIVWVAPEGSHAASAGTFITIAGHVAAMAPGTNIGAATPISGSGEDIEDDLGRKIENDTAAFIRAIAEERGRNAEFAEAAVREAEAISASEAVEMNVVDFIARDLDEVLAQSNGLAVTTASGRVVLETEGARVVENDMTTFESFLSIVADPNIAFLMLSLGGVLLLFGLLHAGTFLPETLGALMLLMGFFALSVIPYSTVGVLLIGLALILLTAELFVPGTGALGIVGVVALVLGGLFLTSTSDPDYQVSRWVVFITAGLIGAFFIFVLQMLIKTRRIPVVSGINKIIGSNAIADTELDPAGKVRYDGEVWNARSDAGPVLKGDVVRITDVHGLELTVRRFDPALDDIPPEPPAPPKKPFLRLRRKPSA